MIPSFIMKFIGWFLVVVWQAWICNYVIYCRDLHFFICGYGCIGCRQMEDGTSKVSVNCILPYILSSPFLCLFQHKINICWKKFVICHHCISWDCRKSHVGSYILTFKVEN